MPLPCWPGPAAGGREGPGACAQVTQQWPGTGRSAVGTICSPALAEGAALLSPSCNCYHLFPAAVFVDVFLF